MNSSDFMQRVEIGLVELSKGNIVIVVDDFSRENEGDLIALAATITPEAVTFLATYGRGLICQPITAARAEELDLPLMARKVTDPYRTAFTVTVDHKSSTTGISAFERARTIRSLVEDETQPEDLLRPGHIFPLIARDGGVLERRGHTETVIDLARLAGRAQSGILCEIMKDDGTMARLPDLEVFAQEHGLHMLSVDDLVRYRDAIGDVPVMLESESELPTEFGRFRIACYRSGDPAARELVLLESDGANERDTVPLVRLHSECLTGEAFGSHRCDCGPQLEIAMERIGREGGAVVYLRQEGRGIGLSEKIRAYALQDSGMDTVDANLALGHEADGRRFGAAAAILRERGYDRVRLLTNNPAKEQALTDAGIDVAAREDLTVGVSETNRGYLKTKAERMGHVLLDV
jgi:3,4-dihydroxy 2-butanone 4-phosphate synthase/GTP cyclohydrolase II